MRLEFLSDHPHHIETLAHWHYAQWKDLVRDWSLGAAWSELRSHKDRAAIPTTVVALEGDELLGSASLILEDIPELRHYSPWLASVYVREDLRGRGVGKALVNRVVEVARSLKVPTLYLFTTDKAGYYQTLGWEFLEAAQCNGQPITVMKQKLGEGLE